MTSINRLCPESGRLATAAGNEAPKLVERQ